MDSIDIPYVTIGRRNKYTITFTQNGVAIPIDGYTVHLSVLSGDEEKIHVSEDTHYDASAGQTILYITQTQADELVPGAWYDWEISLVDPSGYPWGVAEGMLQGRKFQGSVA